MAEIVGSRLEKLIEDRDSSQTKIARAIGVSQPTIGRLISGETRETGKLLELARELRTTPEYLVGETDDPGIDAVGEKRLSWTPPVRDADDDTAEIEEVDMTFGMGATFIDGHVDSRKIRLSRSYLRCGARAGAGVRHIRGSTATGDGQPNPPGDTQGGGNAAPIRRQQLLFELPCGARCRRHPDPAR